MKTTFFRRAFFRVMILFCWTLLSSCAYTLDFGYYGHIARGQMEILAARTPIRKMLVDKNTPAELKTKLRLVLEIRSFAVSELGLPETDSFLAYSDMKREFANWALIAAPPTSLTPKKWRFPIRGEVSHLTFYDESTAKKYADRLQKQGYDVFLRGATAYSTNRWFSDPVLNTFFGWPDYVLAGTIFHEWAHEKILVKGDDAFNESFASFVEEIGQVLWAEKKRGTEYAQKILKQRKRTRQLTLFIDRTRRELRALYLQKIPREEMLLRKQYILASIPFRYETLKELWGGYGGFDAYMKKGWNNARFAHEGEYTNYVPLFQKLYDSCVQNLECFYKKSEEIANLSEISRKRKIREIMESQNDNN